MRKTKFQRIVALMLALVFLLCGGVVYAGAETQSSTNITSDSIRQILNAISYNEYVGLNDDVPKAEQEIVIDATKDYTFVTSNGVVHAPVTEGNIGDGVVKENIAYVGEFSDGTETRTALYTPSTGTVTWDISGITESARYSMIIEYYPIANRSASIERTLKVNGVIPFAEARALTISKIWQNVYEDGKFEVPEDESAQDYLDAAEKIGIKAEKSESNGKTYIIYTMPEYWTEETASLVDEQTLRFFTEDIDLNEIRSSLIQTPVWTEYHFKDASGFMQDSFEFVVGPDEDTNKTTISLEAINEPIVISSIRLVPYEGPITYAEYLEMYENEDVGEDKIKIESEFFSASSSQTIYPLADNTSAVSSPMSTEKTYLNTVGGDKWQTSGQWLEYKFKVNSSGMYTIATRFKQELLDGMYTSRAMYIYSDDSLSADDKGYYNGLPFAEAGRLQFGYSSDWQSGMLTDGKTDSFDIYFEEDVEYTIRFEVTLGSMGDIVRRVQESLDTINEDYLSILKLTGSNPDQYRDYGFSRVMPDVKINMILRAKVLEEVSQELSGIAGTKSSMTATIDEIARLLDKMGKDDDQVAKNLGQLKTSIGTLGTWLSDAKTQPLVLDYIVIQSADDTELPVAKAGFFESLLHEIKGFIQSFFRNYDRMGTMEDAGEEASVEVWIATGRDQAQVIRGLVNNGFTPQTGVAVNLKLVAGGTLLPSILAKMGPDVYVGVTQNDVINYAIRGALLEIEDREGFDEVIKDFDESAMLPLGTEDAEGTMHYYGLPESQSFSMMYIRNDIFAELDLDIPRTWDDVKELIPTLQANNMEIGMIKDENIFLYQLGGELFADGGMRINLDSNVALDAFNTMCEMFTMYSFPYSYDFANRFRTGEMPIGFADYVATHNQLKVFATEIEGLWSFYPMPGYADENGNVNNASVSVVNAISMMTGCRDEDNAWKFMKWHADEQYQIDYAMEMIALLGPSAKQATANVNALRSMPWTDAEFEQINLQFNNIAAIPNYPGRYIVERYTQFAFLAAFNEQADPATEMLSYIKTINTEITRKRQEFGLETLELGQTLAQKRMAQAEAALIDIHDSSDYDSDYDDVYNNTIELIKDYTTEDYASLRALADRFEELNAELFANAVSYMRSAATALESYEAYK